VAMTVTAAKQSFPAPSSVESKPADSPDEKMQKLITALKSGHCTSATVPADEKPNQAWQGSWELSGPDCALDIKEYSSFNPTLHQWNYSRAIAVNSKDFHDASGLTTVAVSGSLGDGPVIFGQHTVAGSFKYGPFISDGVPPITVTVDVRPIDDKIGQIELLLKTGDLVAGVTIRWNAKDRAITLNGREIDDNTYAQLFSSFQLLELLDRIRKMM
jgi:hypothetical protein